jgi:2,3-bisphosphoglycerate-independent phosphoglycerate mutase
MKRVMVMVDAAGDFPYADLRDQTPLDVARSPNARALAAAGRCGTLKRSAWNSSHAMAMLTEACGYSARGAKSIRWGPLAARAAGGHPDSSRFRALAHFLTVMDGEVLGAAFPHSDAEQEELLGMLETELSEALACEIRCVSFGKGRFILDVPRLETAPQIKDTPTDLTGKSPEKLTRGWPEVLQKVILLGSERLAGHPINGVRLDLGENPINGLWLWSGGSLSGVSQSEGLRGQAMMSCEPLALGLADALGLPSLSMESPFGLDRIDAAFDVGEFMKLLRRSDEVVVWVPAPFARGPHEGPEEKVRRLDAIDYYITGPIRAVLETEVPGRMLLLAAGIRHHGRPEKGRAPFVLWGKDLPADAAAAWSEREGVRGDLGSPRFSTLLEVFRT